MDLLVAGIVVFALLIASYSTRGDWIALGSTALSIVLVAGFVFLSTAEEANSVHDGLTRLATKLPSGWDRRALDLANAVEQASAASAAARKRAAEHTPEPILAMSMSDWFSWGRWSKSAPEAETEAEPDAEPASDAGPEVPIEWLLDKPSLTSSETFALSGTNVAEQPLKNIQAVLKPDASEKDFDLVLQLDGAAKGHQSIIPPGARFSLAAAALTKQQAQQLGGAILSVSYVQEGKRKTSIMYLSPPTMAALAASD